MLRQYGKILMLLSGINVSRWMYLHDFILECSILSSMRVKSVPDWHSFQTWEIISNVLKTCIFVYLNKSTKYFKFYLNSRTREPSRRSSGPAWTRYWLTNSRFTLSILTLPHYLTVGRWNNGMVLYFFIINILFLNHFEITFYNNSR